MAKLSMNPGYSNGNEQIITTTGTTKTGTFPYQDGTTTSEDEK